MKSNLRTYIDNNRFSELKTVFTVLIQKIRATNCESISTGNHHSTNLITGHQS